MAGPRHSGGKYHDRVDAGRRLAEYLHPYRSEDPLVVGLPRGGVIVAREVARVLDAPLDVIVTRKLGAPEAPEMAVGAVAPGGVVYVDKRYPWDRKELEQAIDREQAELKRRVRRYRHSDELPDVRGRLVIVVDDGIATGHTATAAVRAVQNAGAKRIVLAVPVCPHQVAELFEEQVDDFICPHRPALFYAVGAWYEHFDPVTDAQVLACLASPNTGSQDG